MYQVNKCILYSNTQNMYMYHIISCILNMTSVPDLDKERPWANPLVRPLPIPHLHDWRKMEVCLINFNKGKDA